VCNVLEEAQLPQRDRATHYVMSLEIMSAAAQKSHLERFVVDEWSWRSLKVVGVTGPCMTFY